MLMKAVEARRKAEVAYMHTNKCKNTHTVHSIKSALVIIPWIESLFLSFLCALSLHSFFFLHTYQVKSKDSGPQALSFECAAALG